MGPGTSSGIDFGDLVRHGVMFGTAGLPHILMRFFTVPSARRLAVCHVGYRLESAISTC
jgi:Na+(H+)/acetate symporter ActP